jgi:hypothetical protein
MMLLFIPRNQSTRGVEPSKDTLVAAGTRKVGLADWKSTRLTWALTGTIAVGAVGLADLEVSLADLGQASEVVGLADWEVGLADSEQAAEAVGLADLEQAGVSLADFKVGSADSEQADNPLLLLIGA